MRLLLAASLVLAWSAPPSVLQVSTRGGVERIALRQDAQHGALVPLAPLARAVGATIEQRPPWVVLTAKSARFRFLAGTPLVADGEEMRPLPAPTVQLGDTTWVPLAFVADVLADPARRAWHWNAANTMLAEGPPVSQLVTRPAPTATPRNRRDASPTTGEFAAGDRDVAHSSPIQFKGCPHSQYRRRL